MKEPIKTENRERLRGRITTLKFANRGYAFVSAGAGEESFFLLLADLAPKAWVRGALIEFTPVDPRRGRAVMAAGGAPCPSS